MSRAPTADTSGRRRGGMVRQAGWTSGAAAIALVAGLGLDAVIAARLGAGVASDAFFVGARLPLAVASILTVGGNQALVPALANAGVNDLRSTWKLASGLLVLSLAAGAAIAGLGIVLADPLVVLTAPGLDAAAQTEAAEVMRLMFLTVPLIGIAEVLRALLNARRSFAVPAAVHAVLSIAAVAVIVLDGGEDPALIAYAYLVGGVAQVLFLVAVALRIGYRPERRVVRDHPELWATARLCGRPLAGASLNPAARVGEQLVVSFLPPGSITILNYGYRLISAVGGSVFFRSVVVTLVPRLSEAAARGDDRATTRVTTRGFHLMALIAAPLTALMALLAAPSVRVLFARGDFDLDDADMLGAVLAVYAASLIGSGIQRVLLAPFFARLDTRTPWHNTVIGVVANLVLAAAFVLPFADDDLAVLGIPLAYGIAQYLNVVHAWWALRRSGSDFWVDRGWTLRLALAVVVGSAGMAAVGQALSLWTTADAVDTTIRTAITGGVGVALMAAVKLALERGDWRALPEPPPTLAAPAPGPRLRHWSDPLVPGVVAPLESPIEDAAPPAIAPPEGHVAPPVPEPDPAHRAPTGPVTPPPPAADEPPARPEVDRRPLDRRPLAERRGYAGRSRSEPRSRDAGPPYRVRRRVAGDRRGPDRGRRR